MSRHASRPQNTSIQFPVALARTLSGDYNVPASHLQSYNVFPMDPGGAARNVDLPNVKNGYAVIVNTADAAEEITVRDTADATVATIAQNERGVFHCDGSNWYGYVGGIT